MDYNRRITDDMSTSSNAVSILVKGAVAIAAVAIVAILLASIFGGKDSMSTILQIVGIAVLIINALIALAQRESAKGINGRMEQVIAVTSEKKRLEAVVDTLAATTAPEVAHLTSDSKDQQQAARDDKAAKDLR